MNLRDYVDQRIGVFTRSIETAKRSVEANSEPKARATLEKHIQSMSDTLDELRYLHYYAAQGSEHPNLHPEWDGSPGATSARRIRDTWD